jgi:hypothetical protein
VTFYPCHNCTFDERAFDNIIQHSKNLSNLIKRLLPLLLQSTIF